MNPNTTHTLSKSLPSDLSAPLASVPGELQEILPYLLTFLYDSSTLALCAFLSFIYIIKVSVNLLLTNFTKSLIF